MPSSPWTSIFSVELRDIDMRFGRHFDCRILIKSPLIVYGASHRISVFVSCVLLCCAGTRFEGDLPLAVQLWLPLWSSSVDFRIWVWFLLYSLYSVYISHRYMLAVFVALTFSPSIYTFCVIMWFELWSDCDCILLPTLCTDCWPDSDSPTHHHDAECLSPSVLYVVAVAVVYNILPVHYHVICVVKWVMIDCWFSFSFHFPLNYWAVSPLN